MFLKCLKLSSYALKPVLSQFLIQAKKFAPQSHQILLEKNFKRKVSLITIENSELIVIDTNQGFLRYHHCLSLVFLLGRRGRNYQVILIHAEYLLNVYEDFLK